MPMSRDQKRWAAARRAQFSLRVALERIDFMEDVLKPELDALGSGAKKLESAEDPTSDSPAALGITDADKK